MDKHKHRESKESKRFNKNGSILAGIVLVIVVIMLIYLYYYPSTVPQIENPPNEVQTTRSY